MKFVIDNIDYNIRFNIVESGEVTLSVVEDIYGNFYILTSVSGSDIEYFLIPMKKETIIGFLKDKITIEEAYSEDNSILIEMDEKYNVLYAFRMSSSMGVISSKHLNHKLGLSRYKKIKDAVKYIEGVS